jgi:DNA polymerase-3 subunit delta'
MSSLIGHEFQRKALRHLLASRRLPSTMMFAGVQGIGKLLVARELARSIFCECNQGYFSKTETAPLPSSSSPSVYGGCGACHHCHVFNAGNHPDFHFVESGDRERWNVQQVRELLYSLHLGAFGGNARVVVFNNAEALSIQIANTLLKILEEPQPHIYFILITSNPSKLPPPLLSRCQIWFFDSLRDDQVATILKARPIAAKSKHPSAPQDAPGHLSPEELAVLADGSLQSIDEIEHHHSDWELVKRKLDDISEGSLSTAALFAAAITKDKERLPMLLQLMRILARRRMLEAAREGNSRRDLSARWAIFIENIIAAEYYLFERNLAPLPVLTMIFSALAGNVSSKDKASSLSLSCFMNSATLLNEIAT